MTGRHARVVHDLDAPVLVACEATTVPHPETATCVAPRVAVAPEPCYVCGGAPHGRLELHDYWSTSDAARHFAGEPSGGTLPSMSAVETLDPREAVYL